jgi:hypothetical protein
MVTPADAQRMLAVLAAHAAGDPAPRILALLRQRDPDSMEDPLFWLKVGQAGAGDGPMAALIRARGRRVAREARDALQERKEQERREAERRAHERRDGRV